MPKIVHIADYSADWRTENYIDYALGDVIKVKESTFENIEDADMVLFHKLNIPNADKVIADLRKRGILTVCWIFDLYHGLPWRSLDEEQFKADIVFSTGGAGGKLLRQGIHGPENVMLEGKKEYDIVFVGGSNPKRAKLLNWLQNQYGDRFHHCGDKKQIRGTELNELFAKTKIVIGDSVPYPNYWSNRIYETLGRGGFLLHPRVKGLDEEFTPFKHYVPYRKNKDLKEVIDYYLTHDEERERIQKAGFEQSKKYTYEIRVKQLLNECGITNNSRRNKS